jgi:uncharacterized protein YecE (DUF72 family)
VGSFHVGTSGWVYRSWRGRFYPEGVAQRRWLAHYATVFDCVEVNGSFYRLPEEATFRRWAESVPDGFRFAVKGSRYVTHFQRLSNAADSVERVTSRARALGDRLGPILWQLRPDMRMDLERLDGFLAVLPPDLRHVLEPRHESWFVEPVRERLIEANVAICAWEMLGVERAPEPTADLAYVRFHGNTRKYGGAYPDEVLADWAERMRGWDREVWAFFNNDIDGHAVEDAQRLRAMLSP